MNGSPSFRVEMGLHQIKEPTALHIKIMGHLLAGPSELRHVTTSFVNSLAHNNQLMQVVSVAGSGYVVGGCDGVGVGYMWVW